MALTNSYLVTTKNLQGVIDAVKGAKAPERFTTKFLEALGFKSSNDRSYISLFKALGLLEDSGQPTQRYFEFLDETQTGKVLAKGIEEAYEDLFAYNKEAQNMSTDEIKNKLKTLTQGQKKDSILNFMANTFKALCALADWNTSVEPNIQQIDISKKEIKNDNIQTSKRAQEEMGMNLHYNIQIHLPETSNMAVYDAIFQSLKKHLM